MASAAANQTIGTTPTLIFDSDNDGGKPAAKIVVGCSSSSLNTLLVQVEGLHKADEYFPIYAGGEQIFEGVIERIYAKGSGGDAIADWGVVAR